MLSCHRLWSNLKIEHLVIELPARIPLHRRLSRLCQIQFIFELTHEPTFVSNDYQVSGCTELPLRITLPASSATDAIRFFLFFLFKLTNRLSLVTISCCLAVQNNVNCPTSSIARTAASFLSG